MQGIQDDVVREEAGGEPLQHSRLVGVQFSADMHQRVPCSAAAINARPVDIEAGARAMLTDKNKHGFWESELRDFVRFAQVCAEAWGLMPDAKMQSGWQPIETAPRDGAYILVYQNGVLEPSQTVVCFDFTWRNDGWWMCCDGKDPERPLRGPAPTHWMHLPKPPMPDAKE